ncbi:hypothetical protein PS15p_212041 [Mucor circinelloides]
MQNDENPIAKETISDNQTTSQQPTAQKQLPDQQLTTNKSNKRKRQPSHDVNYARLLPQCVSRLAELFITDLSIQYPKQIQITFNMGMFPNTQLAQQALTGYNNLTTHLVRSSEEQAVKLARGNQCFLDLACCVQSFDKNQLFCCIHQRKDTSGDNIKDNKDL